MIIIITKELRGIHSNISGLLLLTVVVVGGDGDATREQQHFHHNQRHKHIDQRYLQASTILSLFGRGGGRRGEGEMDGRIHSESYPNKDTGGS